ncbi:hypothetical protein, partial [Phascolarctobacterium succinatutens]|uniref:hypothetical protein n=1 Tax=Phascolarctobacterium succinatutens TaxID=626940 RepID=UPI004029D03C
HRRQHIAASHRLQPKAATVISKPPGGRQENSPPDNKKRQQTMRTRNMYGFDFLLRIAQLAQKTFNALHT